MSFSPVFFCGTEDLQITDFQGHLAQTKSNLILSGRTFDLLIDRFKMMKFEKFTVMK